MLKKGLYLSRVDKNVFTYDLRFKEPNKGDYLHIAAMHTIEHLFATVVRNSEYKDKVVYFGPMGCRTGFYLLLFDTDKQTALEIVKECVAKCLELDTIPGNKKSNAETIALMTLKAQRKNLPHILTCSTP